jgi:hypothetical protein
VLYLLAAGDLKLVCWISCDAVGGKATSLHDANSYSIAESLEQHLLVKDPHSAKIIHLYILNGSL